MIDRTELDMEKPALDIAPSAVARAGFRLHDFEVFHWGTFDQRVWSLRPGGETILLSGDIGSGKSTLVDGLTTLLVPPQKISYNKAAGADTRERSLRSYVMGHYKAERGDNGMGARSVSLRDENSYSVILGVFHDEAIEQTVTLAQVFSMKDPRGQPERFFVVATSRLSIAAHFGEFGEDIGQLRKRLQALPGVTLHDSFPHYAAEFRRHFGIASEQAMELFHQTVSMKSVGNLSDFVRGHMLEAFPVEARIAALIAHFDEANRAHEALVKARQQADQLAPLSADCDHYQALHGKLTQLRGCRNALRSWFAEIKTGLLRKRIDDLQNELAMLANELARLDEERRSQARRHDEIVHAIASNGGNRIEQIKGDIARLQLTSEARLRRFGQYDQLAGALGLPAAADAALFAANRRAIEEGQAACTAQRDDYQDRLTEAGVSVRELGRQYSEITAELDSLRRRRSNIPRRMLELRETLCSALRIAPDSLPFAGELVQVRDDESGWDAAAERVLRDFALSLLVPEMHYSQVAAWIDDANLGDRLVYHRVRADAAAEPRSLPANALARKLAIRPDSPFYAWIEAELHTRFDHACCNRLDEFRREKRVVTRNGQAKHDGERHEKDDRHLFDDRSTFVLGWSNHARISALVKQERDLTTRVQAHGLHIQQLKGEVRDQNALLGDWQRLATFDQFSELDWKPVLAAIDALEREQQELSSSSDLIATLQQQFVDLAAQQAQNQEAWNAVVGALARARERLEQANLALPGAVAHEGHGFFPLIESLRIHALGPAVPDVESCDRAELDFGAFLQTHIDGEEQQLARMRDAIVGAMQDYRRAWPIEAREVDASIESAAEFSHMLRNLLTEDIPRSAARFKEVLSESTVREIAAFQAQLHRERETIRERIATINGSLRQIDYNPNRYIALEAEDNTDADLRDFQQELRRCIEGVAGEPGAEAPLEERFLQVKRVIERFRGREGSAELDRRWTRKVTDSRNWFVFSASERWREDGREHEHYTDASGKSGGQKEKLAYTVLAASLAYQFGLEREERQGRSFRFVVIDEAFGRGSDDSARYGLELFKRLNLQLLVVTPMQKIRIIEPYVAGLGFVHSEEGRRSKLRYLAMDTFRAERSARTGA